MTIMRHLQVKQG